MRRLSLAEIKPRLKARIVEINVSKTLQNKLMSMGIYPGKEVVKISQFLMKGPIALRVSRSVLALGYNTASKIILEVE